MPASVARLSSSSSVKPAAHAASRSPTVDAHAAGRRRRVGRRRREGLARRPRRRRRVDGPGPPAIRARRSRGARPRSTIAVSRGVVGSSPSSSAVTTAVTRPIGVALEPDELPAATVTTALGAASTPAALERAWPPRARSAIPASSLPGQTGWISAAPVATTISSRLDVEHPVRRPGDDGRAGVDRRRPRRRRPRRGRSAPSRAAAAAAAAVAAADDATSTSTWTSLDRRRRAASALDHGEWRHRLGRVAVDRPCPAGPRSGRSGRRRRRRPRRGSSRSRRRGRASRRDPAPRRRGGSRSRPSRPARARWAVRRRRSAPPAPVASVRLGHWRIRRPCGSNSGSGWSRAGRRRPMISISKPPPPGPSGVASAVGT